MGGAVAVGVVSEGVVTRGGIAVTPPTWCHVVSQGLSGRGGLSALGAAVAARGAAMADGDGARRVGDRSGTGGSRRILRAICGRVPIHGGGPAAELAWKAPHRAGGPLNASFP